MINASDLRHFAGTLTASLALVALASNCASGQRPDTRGVEPGRYLARFSGEWALDQNASDNPARALDAHAREAPHGEGRRGGGGGHGPGRHLGGGGGSPDPAALEATFDIFRTVPERFTLTVTDSFVVTTWAGEREARLPIASDAIPMTVQGRRIEVKARWDGGKLRLAPDRRRRNDCRPHGGACRGEAPPRDP